MAHWQSRNDQGGTPAKHRTFTSLDVHSQQNILVQEHGAAKGNAKMFPFHGWKLSALADLPQAPAGAQRMWILNQPHFQTTERQWKGRDNTFENIQSCSLLLPVSSWLPISWDSQHSFRTGFLGRIKWGSYKLAHILWVFLRVTARKRGKRGHHHPHSKHRASFTSLCCTVFFHEWSLWWRSLGRGADPAPSDHFESLKLGSGDLWDWDSMCETKTGGVTDLNVFSFSFLYSFSPFSFFFLQMLIKIKPRKLISSSL